MLTRISMTWPRVVLALWLATTAVLAVFALSLPGDVKAGGFNDQHGSASVGQKVNEKAFHDPANELAVVLHSATPLTPQHIAQARDAARRIPGVTSVADARAGHH